MANEKIWIEQAEDNHMFSGGDSPGDAQRMLEISPTNRDLSGRQAMLLIINRGLCDINHGAVSIAQLCNDVEQAQLVTDGQSRKDFMKEAIEQWQGKLANSGKLRKSLEQVL